MRLPQLLLLILLTQTMVGQSLDTLYYDIHWNLVHKQHALFYRVAHLNREQISFQGGVSDYLLANQQVLMEGNYQQGRKEGLFTFYHINGLVASTGVYKNNQRSGRWQYFYPNQQPAKV